MIWHVPNMLSKENTYTFERKLFMENLQRCKLFSKIVIVFESILIVLNLITKITSNQSMFMFDFYLIMYVLLSLFSIFFILYIRRYEKGDINSHRRYKLYHYGVLSFVILFLLWGVGITLVDQQQYGHLMAFLVNVICVSILFHASNKTILQLYALPLIFLYVGLPFYQTSTEVLVGHYINLTVFLFFCWLASRMLYRSKHTNFYNELLLKEANQDLALKVEENEKINKQLEEANINLQRLALIDELTKVPNRRGFQEYIEQETKLFEEKRKVSLLMIDIDAFKQYNDYYGHLEGDIVIQSVAQKINSLILPDDGMIARFGGEEFVVAIFDKDDELIFTLAKSICEEIELMKIQAKPSPVSDYVTISIGIATDEITNESELETLMKNADVALYQAKEHGRNRVEIYS